MRQMQSAARALRVTSALLNLLFPSSCPGCNSASDRTRLAPFCSACWDRLRRYDGAACRVCALPIAADHADICAECLAHPPAFSRASSYGVYEGTLAAAIAAFKGQGIRRLACPLAGLMAPAVPQDADALVPVPLSPGALRQRGFNQSLLLAHAIAGLKQMPLIIDGLAKHVETAPQKGLSARNRAANLRGAFTASETVRGLRLVLVDDVMTTGATVRECSRMLIEAGASEVHVAVLARAGSP